MKFKTVVVCLAALAFITGSSCAMAKTVDNQQKVEKQEKIEKKNNKKSSSEHQGIQRRKGSHPYLPFD